MTEIRPLRPQTIGGVLDTAFELYKRSVLRTWPLSLLMAIGGAIPSAYVIYQLATHPEAGVFDLFALIFDAGYAVSIVVMFVVLTWFSGAMYLREDSIARGEPMGNLRAFGLASRRLWQLSAGVLLYMLVVLIGAAFFIIPGVILFQSMILLVPLIVFEHRGPIAALRGSHRLIMGRWWRTSVIFLVAVFDVIVLYVAAGVLTELLSPSPGAMDFAEAAMRSQIIALIGGAVVSLMVTPFYVAVGLSTYWDLKLRRNGADLIARVEALSTA
jgi:hypothetical protein